MRVLFCAASLVAGSVALAAENHGGGGHPAAVNHAAAPAGHGGMEGHPGGFGGGHDAFRHDAGHDGFRHDGGAHYAFREHDVHRFGHDDLARWRGGRWNHTCYGGRCGWWWFAGGQWYFYDSPVYPYPLAVSSVAYVEPVAVAPVVAAPPPMAVAPAPRPRYYCDNPAGYYPAVQNCSTQFRQVSQ